ncbi:MAG: hypothetical protein K8S54_09940 [Spirochaetia bacterium]|nr:hypothetical protein [Spirochaetia bacterium]
MKRRYLKFWSGILFFSGVLTVPLNAQEIKRAPSETGQPDRSDQTGEKRPEAKLNLIEVQLGPAVSASGSIVASSEDGITLLERLINSGTLYAPRVTPLIQAVGPGYKIPPFHLGSNQIGVSYERYSGGRFSFGGAIRYTDVTAGLTIPESFIPGSLVNFQAPVISRVTAEIHSRKVLASAFQVEGVMSYHFNGDAEWDPYLRASGGVGRGWLAHVGYGPHLEELHGTIGAGMRWNFNETSSISAEINTSGFWVMTGPSSFIDRTDVLINPGKGSIYIVRLLLGAGYRF